MIHFDLSAILQRLASLELVLGLFLVCAGLVFLLMGVRIAKVLIGLSFGVIGFVIGSGVPAGPGVQAVVGVVTALGLAATASYVFRPAVAVLAGSWAAVAVMGLLSTFRVEEQIVLIATLFTFASVISLTFIMLQEIIAFVTSFEGTILFLAGLVVFAAENATLYCHITNMMVHMSFFLPFAILAGTFTGIGFQMAELRKKQMGMTA